MNKLRESGLWAGTQASYDTWASMDAAVVEKMMAYNPNDTADDQEEDIPYLFSKQGSVGIVSIRGSITNRDSWLNEYFGITSYGAIREAVIHAAEDPEVTDILLDIDSGGGSVNGCMDTGSLISLVNAKVKPVTTFASGMMASAAYWLGSSAGEVYASATSDVGSIGVIAVHMERSKMLKDEGIGVTVVRSGEYKALANGVEPLSEEGRAQLQAQLDAAYKLFVNHVAEARNVPYDYCDKSMAQGREFFGEQALSAGLIDGVTTFDAVMQGLLNKSIDTSNNSMNNRANNPQGGAMKRTLSTEQLMAAAAEGIAAGVVGAEPAAEVPAPAATEVPAPAAEVPAEAPAPAAEASAAPAADSAVVALLTTQVKEANAALLQANLDLAKANEALAAVQATHDGLMAIAKKSVSNMRVALGGTGSALEGSTAAALLAEHGELSAKFQATFKVGGVASVDAADAPATKQADPDPRYLARVNAAIGK